MTNIENLDYRDLKPHEVREVIELGVLTFENSNDPNDFTRDYAESEFPLMFSENFNKPLILIGRNEKQIVCMCVLNKHQVTDHNINLTWVAVHPDYRGQGYGKALMKFCEEKVLELLNGHAGALSFTTSEHNFDFYRKLGFEKGMSIQKPKSWFHKVYNDQ